MLKALFSFSFMTFLSRITGFIRDVFIARFFGTSLYTDAFFVAFRIPNLFRRIFAEGAFSLSFIPILAQAKKESQFDEKDFIARSLAMLTSVVMVFALIGSLAAPAFIFILAPGLENEASSEASYQLRVMFPYIALISLSAFFQSILHSYHRYALAAITPIFLNLALIFCLIFLAHHLTQPIYALSFGVLIGGLLQFVWPFYFVYRLNLISRPKLQPNSLTQKMLKNMLPIIFSSSVSQINILVDTFLASMLITGSISWLYYANRLIEMPIGMIGVALATVGVSYFATLFQQNKNEVLNESFHHSLSLAIVFGLPCFFALLLLSELLIISLFEYGNFSNWDAQMTANALQALALSVPMILLTKVLSSAFFALKQTKIPSKIALFCIGINLACNLALMPFLAHVGLALASSISAFCQTFFLMIALKQLKVFKLDKKNLVKIALLSGGFSLVLLLSLLFIFKSLGFEFSAIALSEQGLLTRLVLLGTFVLLFALIYLPVVHLWIVPFNQPSTIEIEKH